MTVYYTERCQLEVTSRENFLGRFEVCVEVPASAYEWNDPADIVLDLEDLLTIEDELELMGGELDAPIPETFVQGRGNRRRGTGIRSRRREQSP